MGPKPFAAVEEDSLEGTTQTSATVRPLDPTTQTWAGDGSDSTAQKPSWDIRLCVVCVLPVCVVCGGYRSARFSFPFQGARGTDHG